MKRPDYTDMLAAARVSDFIEVGEQGRWRVKHYNVTDESWRLERLRIMHECGDDEFSRTMKLERQIPPGPYCTLSRRATEREMEDNEYVKAEGYMPIMSDTPAEINEHQHAFMYAGGRVLIHGLGLGVLVSALLAAPHVDHIDVVEIDPDVIALIGPYYTHDPRVHIHQGDCLRMDWSPEIEWDYVWHDIWSDISWKNLDPELAEHGISYGMLFDTFADRAGTQGAWAYNEAMAMELDHQKDLAEIAEWEERFWSSDRETQVEMVFHKTVRQHLVGVDGRPIFAEGEELPDQFVEFFMDQGLKDHIREALTNKTREEFEASRKRARPLGNPNDALEV